MRTPYILRLGSHRYSVAFTDGAANQTTTPLAADHAPATDAFMAGTDDVCIRRMAHHAGGARYRTLGELADAHDMTPGQLAGARKRGLHVQRAAKPVPTLGTTELTQLRDEAVAAGDAKQVAICERAIDGSARAIRECERVIRAGQVAS